MFSGAGTPTSSISVMMLIAASFSPSLKHRLTASEYNLLQFGTTFSASIKLVCTKKKASTTFTQKLKELDEGGSSTCQIHSQACVSVEEVR
jgi:hypothetical protein